jgi:hypothetical protein
MGRRNNLHQPYDPVLQQCAAWPSMLLLPWPATVAFLVPAY